jgi:hypothetical protein
MAVLAASSSERAGAAARAGVASPATPTAAAAARTVRRLAPDMGSIAISLVEVLLDAELIARRAPSIVK